MPTTVTSSAGTVYHLFQAANSVKTASMGIGFTELRNDLGNGYRSQVLYGSNTGLKKWKLTLPTLADTTVLPNTYTGVNNESLSREMYLWDLYCETRVTGQPFVYTDPRTGQYYLVDFMNDGLEYSQDTMAVKLYSTGVEIEQVRENGETVFDFNKLDLRFGEGGWWNQTTHGVGLWDDLNLPNYRWTATGGVTFSANPQNGLNTVRFNGSTGVVNMTLAGAPSQWQTWDAFMVLKVREATFSNNAGVMSGLGATPMLIGTSGATKFQNLSHLSYEYRLNGVEYAQSNQQAPMNAWGIVHARWLNGAHEIDQIGLNGVTGGTFAAIDVAEIYLPSSLIPMSDCREVVESLAVKWNISI